MVVLLTKWPENVYKAIIALEPDEERIAARAVPIGFRIPRVDNWTIYSDEGYRIAETGTGAAVIAGAAREGRLVWPLLLER